MASREFSTSLSLVERTQVEAARASLERGDWQAAGRELRRMRAATRMHRDVLRLRFRICAAARDWETAFTIADALVSSDESDAEAWVYRSDALHALNRTAEADALLRPALS